MTKAEDHHQTYLKSNLTYRLARVHARLNAQAVRVLKNSSGISLLQWRVLTMIYAGGSTAVVAADVQRTVDFDKGLLSRTLRKLVADGLVKSDTDSHDQRRQNLELTDAGRALYESTLPVMRARQERLRAALEPGEVDLLLSILKKLEAVAIAEETQ